MTNLFKMIRAAPFIAYYRLTGSATSNYKGQWESYWSSVKNTGEKGEVLWDSEYEAQMAQALAELRTHADFTMPIVDLGCGNGRRSVWLARHFKRVISVDVSQAAVTLAKQTCAGIENIDFEVLDITDDEAVRAFAECHGEVNIHTRGVLHLIKEQHRPRMTANLSLLLGQRGVLYFHETDGTALEYFLSKPGNSPSGLPAGMHKVIEHGILPSGFGSDAHKRWFSPAKWETLSASITTLTTVPFVDGEAGHVPSFYAVVRACR